MNLLFNILAYSRVSQDYKEVDPHDQATTLKQKKNVERMDSWN